MAQKKKNTSSQKESGNKKDLPGYPSYPANEDIYNQQKEETDIDPEQINKTKTPNEKSGTRKRKEF